MADTKILPIFLTKILWIFFTPFVLQIVAFDYSNRFQLSSCTFCYVICLILMMSLSLIICQSEFSHKKNLILVKLSFRDCPQCCQKFLAENPKFVAKNPTFCAFFIPPPTFFPKIASFVINQTFR